MRVIRLWTGPTQGDSDVRFGHEENEQTTDLAEEFFERVTPNYVGVGFER